MNTIWKTPLGLSGSTVTAIESGRPAPLSVGIDANGVPSVWYWAPTDEAKYFIDVEIIGTGIPAKEMLPGYLGTFVYRSLVLHAFHTVGERT
jgi:hypothetical protein